MPVAFLVFVQGECSDHARIIYSAHAQIVGRCGLDLFIVG